jgi:uroporphyrinogen decarboxylase
MDDLFLKALRCEKVPRPPVWLMRQAGRYMPQYQALRKKHSLWEMFHKPEVAAAITRLPLELLNVDAAILFSDILVIAEAFGLSIQFPEGKGPRIESFTTVEALTAVPVEEALSYVLETIRIVKPTIDVPLIGFCGGPFTVASYLTDAKSWVKQDPTMLHALLAKNTDATIAYLKAQIKAGVDAIQVFDSWANLLDDAEFDQFSLFYLSKIVRAIDIPVILFCRDSSLRAEKLAALQPAAISFDWHLPMADLRRKVPPSIAVQGNFPPEFLKQPREAIATGVNQLLDSMQDARGFIVNLGHGVLPDTPFENVRYFVESVRSFEDKK